MAENLTISSLLARGKISKADLTAAVDAYLSDPETTAYPLGDQSLCDGPDSVDRGMFGGGKGPPVS